jgi:hypothetical protein
MATLFLGGYAVGILSRRTRDELWAWGAARTRKDAFVSSTGILLPGQGAETWNRGS